VEIVHFGGFMPRPRLTLASLLVVLACGGGGDTTSPTNNPPAGGSSVTIRDFNYTPANLTVKVGTTVTWNNLGPTAHTTVSDNGVWTSPVLSGPSSGGSGYGGGNSAGGTFQFTFTQAGTFPYHCNLHPPSSFPNFVGTITVTP
jgi:plastocyanin